MTNLKPLLKRIGAYLIDLFIVFLISSLISSIPAINKNMDSYQKTYDEYEEKYNDYANYINLLKDLYEDNEINEEEYNQLIESTQYGNIIISKYEDSKISKKEYQQIVEEVNTSFDSVAKEYVYLLNKDSALNTIITLICTLLYFGILQYFLNGKTIGKSIFKLQVVSNNEKKLNILNYFLRSLVVNDVLLNAISIIFLITASKTIYQNANNIISTIISIVEAIIIFLVMTREDHRGLHDLLFNTKVIETDCVNDGIKIQEVKGITPIEDKKTKSTSKSKSNKRKTTKKKIIDAEYKENKK